MCISNDFSVVRCVFVHDKLRASEPYTKENAKLLLCIHELTSKLETERQHQLLNEYSERSSVVSCITEEACYLQGFRDMLRLMAGLPLEC